MNTVPLWDRPLGDRPLGDRPLAGRCEGRRSIKALVTGGGGFLGRAIVEQLRARGDQVRSFSRGRYPELEAMGVDTVQGDLGNLPTVRAACADCDVVFHVAAKAGIWGSYKKYYQANVRGTENVIAACRDRGVGRLVYTSSPSVVFDGSDMEGVDESVPYPARHPTPYTSTKAAAEKLVLAANGARLGTIALRPHLIWGPRDSHIVPRIIAQGRAGKLRLIGRGDNKVDTTYIDNAAQAHLLAADALETNPHAAGRAFFISQGEPVAIRDIINGILSAGGLPPVTRRVPRLIARTAGGLFELVYILLGIRSEPRMTRFLTDELSSSHWFDISAARRELGYEPRVSIEEGLRRLEAWLEEVRHSA